MGGVNKIFNSSIPPTEATHASNELRLVPVVSISLHECRRLDEPASYGIEIDPISKSQFGRLSTDKTDVRIQNVRVVTSAGEELPIERLATCLHPEARLAVSPRVTLKADAFVNGKHQVVVMKNGIARIELPAISGSVYQNGQATLANGHSFSVSALVGEQDCRALGQRLILRAEHPLTDCQPVQEDILVN